MPESSAWQELCRWEFGAVEEEEEDIITEDEKIMIHDLNVTMQYSEIARRYVGELI